MSSKSKTTMDTNEDEVKLYSGISGRPIRNKKLVSYKENNLNMKRPKDSELEPTDKKKKEANGDANVDSPSKKTSKMKVETNDETSGDKDEDKLIHDSRKRKNESKPVADDATNSKKTQPRKKKVEETGTTQEVPIDDSADKKGSEPKEPKKVAASKGPKSKKTTSEASADAENEIETHDEIKNGAGSSKPSVSKTAKSRPKGRKVTSQPSVDAEDEIESPNDMENGAEPSKTTELKAIAKSKGSKGKKVTNQPSVDAENEIKTHDEMENGAGSSKQTESKAAKSKGPKGKKVTSQPSVDAKNEIDTPNAMENGAESSKPTELKAISKSKGPKGKKVTSQPSVHAENKIETQDEVENVAGSSIQVESKATAKSKGQKGKKVTSQPSVEAENKIETQDEVTTKSKPVSKAVKVKKAVKESNDAVDDNAIEEESNNKPRTGRPKKTATKVQPSRRKRKAEASEVVVKSKISKSPEPVDLYVPSENWNFKIISWNVAGLRALIKKDGMEFLKKESPDIICLQETKCLEEEVPSDGNLIGYHKYWLGMKGGQAGVALFSKTMPYDVSYGLNDVDLDQEARLITAEFTKFFLICVYVPNAGRKLVNLTKRLDWDRKFQNYLVGLNERKPVLICGDMNVAHQEIDLANPKTNKRSAGFTNEEREGMSSMLKIGLVDTFREKYPKRQAYTYWTYMANARAKNIGWRLDYFIASERLSKNIVDNVIRTDIFGSDHCPVSLFLNF